MILLMINLPENSTAGSGNSMTKGKMRNMAGLNSNTQHNPKEHV